jgi:hypothetical protein
MLKRLQTEKYYHYESLSRSNDVVHEFLVKNKRIITGGLVIDFSLRLFGEKLYEDYQLPDYDFFSTDPANDASTIFTLLYESGQRTISITPGMHVNTIRVWVHRDPVADITYAHPSLYKQYQKSALVYKDLHFRNPYLQFCDMHRVFYYPYENEPRDVISHRLEKDFIRYCQLAKYYVVDVDDECRLSLDVAKVGRIFNPSKLAKITAGSFMDMCTVAKSHKITDVAMGDFAILYYLALLNPKFQFNFSVEAGIIKYTGFEAKNSILVDDIAQHLLSKEYDGAKKYAAFLEYLPARYEGKTTTMYCLTNKTSVQKIPLPNNTAAAAVVADTAVAAAVTVTGLSFNINYCYAMWNITKDMIYAWLYLYMNKMASAHYMSDTPNKILFPSAITYGSEHEHFAVTYAAEHTDEAVRVTPIYVRPDMREAEIADQLANLPRAFKYNPLIYLMDGLREL